MLLLVRRSQCINLRLVAIVSPAVLFEDLVELREGLRLPALYLGVAWSGAHARDSCHDDTLVREPLRSSLRLEEPSPPFLQWLIAPLDNIEELGAVHHLRVHPFEVGAEG